MIVIMGDMHRRLLANPQLQNSWWQLSVTMDFNAKPRNDSLLTFRKWFVGSKQIQVIILY